MAKVSVTGQIPVVVLIDTDERRVTAVHAIDEEFGPGPEGYEVRTDSGTLLKGVASRKALALVEDPLLTWPGWEWGW